MNKLELPPILSFRRSLEVTDATMTSVTSDGTETTISAYLHGQRPAKSHDQSEKSSNDASSEGEGHAGNLTYGYKAKLPMNASQLRIRTRMTVLPIREVAEATNSTAWLKALPNLLEQVKACDALDFIAKGIAYNLLSAAWTWRNRDVAQRITVTAAVNGQTLLTTGDVRVWPKFGVATPAQAEAGTADPLTTKPEVVALAAAVLEGLRGKPTQISITADLTLLPGQECWPSQLYLPRKRKVGACDIGKEFFAFGVHQDVPGTVDAVGMTAEKVGNAVRTLDRFHGNDDFKNTIVAFESNGTSLQFSTHLRSRGKRIFDVLPKAAADFSSLTNDEKIYLTGWLIRGGLVSGRDNETETEAKKTKTEKAAAPVAT